MKIKLLLLVGLLACVAFAGDPSVRVNNLRSCDSVVIKPVGKDPYTLYGKDKVREVLRYIRIESSAVRGSYGGREMYSLTFFNGANKKPQDVLWVRYGGIWGFKNAREPYGHDDKLIPFLEKSKG